MRKLSLLLLLTLVSCSDDPKIDPAAIAPVIINLKDQNCPVAPVCPVCPEVVACPVVTCPTVPTTPPVVTPPVVTPPTTDSKLLALDSFNTPNQDSTNWKSEITRTVFKNQTTGFAVKGDLCLLVGKAQKMNAIDITTPSAKEYPKGKYYDEIENEFLDATTCKTAEYAWLELGDSLTVGNLKITLKKLTTEAGDPKIPLMIQMSSYAYQMGLDKNLYVNGHESLVKDGMDMLLAHKITPMKSWVTPYSVYSAQYGLKEYVVDYSKTFTNVPAEGNTTLLSSDITKYNVSKPWFYVIDEPDMRDAATVTAIKKTLADLKAKAPNVARMITTTYNKDLDVDIYVPVMEQLNVSGYPDASVYAANNKRLWAYTSCMAHGNCGNNRAWNNGKVISSAVANRTGSPDLLIDAPGIDSFGFFYVAIKYKLEGLLYYNAIEQWGLDKSKNTPKGYVNVDARKDMFNFAGNGDGTLMWPDYDKLKPRASIRLKNLKEASLLANAIYMSASEAEVSSKVDSPLKWRFDYADREKFYSKLK